MSSTVRAEARYWLADCGMDESRAAVLTDEEIRATIERHHEGGYSGFLLAAGL
jgi:hypothetical protein